MLWPKTCASAEMTGFKKFHSNITRNAGSLLNVSKTRGKTLDPVSVANYFRFYRFSYLPEWYRAELLGDYYNKLSLTIIMQVNIIHPLQGVTH